MQVVVILASFKEIETFEDFELDEITFIFKYIPPEGTPMLLDGPCWVFINWMLPELSGLEMCRRLRSDAHTRDAHITMFLEDDDGEDRRRALRAGADDYMLQPVSRQSMLDRILAARPVGSWRSAPELIKAGELTITLAAERASWGDQVLSLRPQEFRLLRFIAENPNRVLSRQELIDAVGKSSGDLDNPRTVDVWIKRLRTALCKAGAGPILRTVTNRGYVLDIL